MQHPTHSEVQPFANSDINYLVKEINIWTKENRAQVTATSFCKEQGENTTKSMWYAFIFYTKFETLG